MARETKAERLAREAAMKAERLEQEKRDYFPNLMATLERASKYLFVLTVKDSKFVVQDVNDSRSFWTLSPEYNSEDAEVMYDLNYELADYEAAEREAQRKMLVRQQALSKLNKEERELLGL